MDSWGYTPFLVMAPCEALRVSQAPNMVTISSFGIILNRSEFDEWNAATVVVYVLLDRPAVWEMIGVHPPI